MTKSKTNQPVESKMSKEKGIFSSTYVWFLKHVDKYKEPDSLRDAMYAVHSRMKDSDSLGSVPFACSALNDADRDVMLTFYNNACGAFGAEHWDAAELALHMWQSSLEKWRSKEQTTAVRRECAYMDGVYLQKLKEQATVKSTDKPET